MKMVDLGKLIKYGEYFDTKIAILKNTKEMVIPPKMDTNSLVLTYDQEKE